MKRSLSTLLSLAFYAAAACHSAALSQPSTPPAGSASAPQNTLARPGPYTLGPDDVVEVSILGRSDFTTRDKINSDGTIQLPFLGTVKAANLTTMQLSSNISQQLESKGIYSHPIMKVELVSYASRYVVVLGDVASPGIIPIDRPYHLSEIVARAGGIKEGGADYVVLRPDHGSEAKFSMAVMATGTGTADPFVNAGDKIFVPKAEQFYISGQIRTPGSYALTDALTFRMALAKGGGLTDAGSEKRISVTRHGKKMNHIDLDSKVEAGDVIVAGESFF